MPFQIQSWLLCAPASSMAWVPSSSQIVFKYCITDTLTPSMHNILMVSCHANVIQIHQHHTSPLGPLRTPMGTVDSFQVHSGCEAFMTRLLKIMEHRLTRRQLCCQGRSVLLIIATRSQSRL